MDDIDSMIGGAVVQDDHRAAVVSAQHTIDQRISVINLAVSELTLYPSECGKPVSAHLNVWCEVMDEMFGRPAVEEPQACKMVCLRIIRGHAQYRRGDVAEKDEKSARLWIHAGVAKLMTREEFDATDYQTRVAA